MQQLLTVKDVATKLACSTATIYRLYHEGELTGIRIRNSVRFTQTDVTSYIEANRHTPKRERIILTRQPPPAESYPWLTESPSKTATHAG